MRRLLLSVAMLGGLAAATPSAEAMPAAPAFTPSTSSVAAPQAELVQYRYDRRRHYRNRRYYQSRRYDRRR